MKLVFYLQIKSGFNLEKEKIFMDIETIILVIGIVSSLIIGFIGGFFAGAYWKTK